MRTRGISLVHWGSLIVVLATTGCQRPLGLGAAPGENVPPISVSPGSGDLLELQYGGETRQYLLYVPASLSSAGVPLVVNLHGFSATARQQELLSGMSAKADAEDFLVVYPQALGDPPAWRVGPAEGGPADLGFIADLVAHLSDQYPIDPKQVFVTGISNGGGMVDRLACERADIFAAAAPVSGAFLFSATCDPSRPVPIVAFHGTADQIVPYEGKGRILPAVPQWAADWAARNGCATGPDGVYQQGEVTGVAWSQCSQGAEVVLYTIQEGGHNWPGSSLLGGLELSTQDVDATDVIWEFFEAHPLP